jgi:hypothetical protein
MGLMFIHYQKLDYIIFRSYRYSIIWLSPSFTLVIQSHLRPSLHFLPLRVLRFEALSQRCKLTRPRRRWEENIKIDL